MIDYRRLVKVSLNGINLQETAPLAVVQKVTEVNPEVDLTVLNRFDHGQRFVQMKRKKKEIRLGLLISSLYDLNERAVAQDQICAWARDGLLEVSYRPWQQLHVRVASRPSLGSVREWTQELEVVLAAYERPYWEDVCPTEALLTAVANVASTGTIIPPGTVDLEPAEVFITNTGSGALNSLSITAGNTAMAFSDLAIPANGGLSISYDENMLLRIMSGTTSKMACRTPASSDDLLVTPQLANAISITGDSSVQAVFRVRGLYE